MAAAAGQGAVGCGSVDRDEAGRGEARRSGFASAAGASHHAARRWRWAADGSAGQAGGASGGTRQGGAPGRGKVRAPGLARPWARAGPGRRGR